MSTLTWSHVQNWIFKNPYKTQYIPQYVSEKHSVLGSISREDDGWIKTPVSPATPLSAILMAQNSYYEATPEMSRFPILRDETTDLQEKAVLHLKGRAWPARRTAEGISLCGIEEGKSSTWTAIGWRALCTLRECQIILINEEKKEISFFPEDIRNWSETIDTFCVDSDCRFVWTSTNAHRQLSAWIGKRESNSWTVEWPIADGTMDELKVQASKCPESFSGKIKKEVLQKKIGKSQSYQIITKWAELQ
jgi:hypothetical protein